MGVKTFDLFNTMTGLSLTPDDEYQVQDDVVGE